MKLIVTLSLALLIFSGFAFAKPTSSFATNNNNNNSNHENENNNNSNNNHNDGDDDENDNDDKVTICHVVPTPHQTLSVSESALRAHLAHGDTRGACAPVNVPEFGMIPGVIAAISSGGTFFYLKKRKFN